MTELTDRDAAFAALLGHKQTESTWKPTLFLIARFREESARLALKGLDDIEQLRITAEKEGLLKIEVAAPNVEPAGSTTVHKLDDSVIWAIFAAVKAVDHPVSRAGFEAAELLNDYKKRFGSGRNT